MRSLDVVWEADELFYMQLGGNENFLNYSKQFNLESLSIPEKYNCVAIAHYRKHVGFVLSTFE